MTFRLLYIPEALSIINRYVLLDVIIRIRHKQKLVIRLTKVSTSQRTKSVERSSSNGSKASVSGTKAKKIGNSKIGDYQYEIDCKKVADSIDVADLVT